MQQGLIVKPGTRLYGASSECEVVVVRPARTDVQIACGGQPMLDDPERRDDALAGGGEPVLIGKRYTHEASGLELLCTRSGAGPLTADGAPLALLEARPLPASD